MPKRVSIQPDLPRPVDWGARTPRHPVVSLESDLLGRLEPIYEQIQAAEHVRLKADEIERDLLLLRSGNQGPVSTTWAVLHLCELRPRPVWQILDVLESITVSPSRETIHMMVLKLVCRGQLVRIGQGPDSHLTLPSGQSAPAVPRGPGRPARDGSNHPVRPGHPHQQVDPRSPKASSRGRRALRRMTSELET